MIVPSRDPAPRAEIDKRQNIKNWGTSWNVNVNFFIRIRKNLGYKMTTEYSICKDKPGEPGIDAMINLHRPGQALNGIAFHLGIAVWTCPPFSRRDPRFIRGDQLKIGDIRVPDLQM